MDPDLQKLLVLIGWALAVIVLLIYLSFAVMLFVGFRKVKKLTRVVRSETNAIVGNSFWVRRDLLQPRNDLKPEELRQIRQLLKRTTKEKK